MQLTPENKFIHELLIKLNDIEPDWLYGDSEENFSNIKSVDIVNHRLKIAIEIKDMAATHLPPADGEAYSTNLKAISKIFKRDIENANKKFRNYPEYESVVLIRHLSRMSKHVLAYIVGGFYTITPYGRINNTEFNISRHSEACAVYGFLNPHWSDEFIFYVNTESNRESSVIVNILKKVFNNHDEMFRDDSWANEK